jgi:hypothetical protein
MHTPGLFTKNLRQARIFGIQYAIRQEIQGGSAMQCPVCCRPARNLTPNTLEGVVVGCDRCGDYRVAGDALHPLMRLALEQRIAALETAKGACQAGWPIVLPRTVRAA